MKKNRDQFPGWFLGLNTDQFKAYLMEHKEIWQEISFFTLECPQITLMLEGIFMEGYRYGNTDRQETL